MDSFQNWKACQIGQPRLDPGQDSSEATFVSFIPPEEDLLKQRGAFFAAGFVPLELLENIQVQYYASSGSILRDLERSLAEAEGLEEIILAVVWGNVLYLVRGGQASCWVFREGKLGKIKFNKSASGRIQKNDSIILLPGDLSSDQEGQLEQALTKGDSSDLEFPEEGALVIKKENDEDLNTVQEEESVDLEQIYYFVVRGSKWSKLLKKALKLLGILLLKLSHFSFKLLKYLFKIARRNRAGKKRSWKFTVVLVLIILGMIVLGWRVFGSVHKQTQNQAVNQFDSYYTEAENKVTEAKGVQDLNPVKAQELLNQAKTDLDQADKTNVNKTKVATLRSELGSLLAAVNKVYKIEAVPVFYNLKDLTKEANGTDLGLVPSGLVVLDKEQRSLYLLNFQTKEASVLKKDDSFLHSSKISTESNLVYILGENGVSQLQVGTNDLKIIIHKDSAWGNIVDLSSWRGNIYLLDPIKQTVWKELPSGNGYNRSVFGKEGTFTQGISLAVDGFIWVGERQTVSKFLKGEDQNFTLQGLDQNPKDLQEIKTDESFNNVYLLDKTSGRLIVVDKNGLHRGTYETEILKQTKSVSVDENKGEVYILSNDKVYLLDLKK